MSYPTAFITGFPGFVARHLIRRLAHQRPDLRFIFLVEARLVERAEDELAALGEALEGRWDLAVGDIGERLLGMAEADYAALAERVTEAWHLAAIYNLAVAERVAHRVNVIGTTNVLDLCEKAPAFERLNYVSTCYVSGRRTGLIREAELDEGQGFNNHYESTKFWAELEVQRRWHRIPSVIFRPGIVVGDSRTGETDKYDGPYYVLKLIERMPDTLPFVNVGKGQTPVNLVPIDFAADAMVTIAAQPDAAGLVYQLADPAPMRSAEVLDLMLRIMGKAPAALDLPPTLVTAALRLRPVRDRVKVPAEVFAYFNHDARYDTSHTDDALAGTRVRCPRLGDYLDTLIDYMRRHPKKTFLDGRPV